MFVAAIEYLPVLVCPLRRLSTWLTMNAAPRTCYWPAQNRNRPQIWLWSWVDVPYYFDFDGNPAAIDWKIIVLVRQQWNWGQSRKQFKKKMINNEKYLLEEVLDLWDGHCYHASCCYCCYYYFVPSLDSGSYYCLVGIGCWNADSGNDTHWKRKPSRITICFVHKFMNIQLPGLVDGSPICPNRVAPIADSADHFDCFDFVERHLFDSPAHPCQQLDFCVS